MNNPEIKVALDKKVRSIKRRATKIINGGVGKDPFDLEKTLERHMQVKNLLEEMEYILQKEIPEEDVLKEVSNVEEELKLIQKK